MLQCSVITHIHWTPMCFITVHLVGGIFETLGICIIRKDNSTMFARHFFLDKSAPLDFLFFFEGCSYRFAYVFFY